MIDRAVLPVLPASLVAEQNASSISMQGLHLLFQLQGCQPINKALLCEQDELRTLCLESVKAQGLQVLGEVFYRFSGAPNLVAQPAGVTGMVLLAESHLAIHTWPETGVVTLDVFVCNFAKDNSAQARALGQTLLVALCPQAHELTEFVRSA